MIYEFFEYEIIDNVVNIIDYKDESVTSLIIPEFIEGLPVTKIGDKAFSNLYILEYIHIPNTVTKIGSFSFAQCNTTLNIVLPNSVTYLGENSFIGNDMLIINNIELKKGVNVVNNRFIFYNDYTSNIMYQINDDYVCDDGYFMDGEFKNRLMCSYGF